MKKFGVILQYELSNYLKNKSFMITTIVICLVATIILFIPRFIDLSDILGTGDKEQTEQEAPNPEDIDEYIVINDKTGILKESQAVESFFINYKVKYVSSRDEIKNELEKNEDVVAGFDVVSLNEFEYMVYDSDMFDTFEVEFMSVMQMLNEYMYCVEHELDYNELQIAFNPVIESKTTVLGKDAGQNYWYCYILVIIVFMIIILYGVMVATSVTQEKSNRTIELLVTSADTNSLFFGKVIAGTLAALVQVGALFLVIVGGYKVNQKYWGGKIDMLLDIPTEVLITFALFGLGGLLFYTFVYGAMGALVSKTEDINKSAGSVQMIIMVVYFIVLFQLTNINGMIMKVLSFIPLSSYSAMFARVGMGEVALWEIIVSFVILVASIIGVGFIGAKIYRMGTLRYGNPIKLSNALKSIRKEK